MEKLFKAKRLDNGEWVVFPLGHTSSFNNVNVKHGVSAYVGSGWREIDVKTICQYTGINDSEGNRIFEGDEVADKDGSRHIVKYCTDNHCLIIGKYSAYWHDLEDLTLTGHNIHDKIKK